ncbi:MAG: glycerophosphodiester phosphodiesterase family protein [Pseudomonadota bacterium]
MKKSSPEKAAREALIDHLEPTVNRLADAIMAAWPRRAPSARELKRCRLITHRGVYDNRRVWENTTAAFDAAVAGGVWGIECDVRWSRDQQAVVFHDPDFRRLAGAPVRVADLTAAQIRERWPQVPLLSELADRYGRRVHLMVELKTEAFIDTRRLKSRLADCLAELLPGRDYHLLSLSPQVLAAIGHAHAEACIPIARERVAAFSRLAAARPYAGLCGHSLLMTTRLLQRHHRMGQGVGTGFSNSRNALYREINRGVDWIFTDRALAMAAICRRSSIG